MKTLASLAALALCLAPVAASAQDWHPAQGMTYAPISGGYREDPDVTALRHQEQAEENHTLILEGEADALSGHD